MNQQMRDLLVGGFACKVGDVVAAVMEIIAGVTDGALVTAPKAQGLTSILYALMRRHDAFLQHLQTIERAGHGVMLYMRQHEGRGIGLPAKIHAYKLQEQGFDTVEANEELGYPAELRDYGIGAQILFDLGVRKMRFLTNNPKKVIGLEGYGMKIVEVVPIKSSPNPHNAKYLETKRVKLGHLL